MDSHSTLTSKTGSQCESGAVGQQELGADGLPRPGKFVQVELMLKDASSLFSHEIEGSPRLVLVPSRCNPAREPIDCIAVSSQDRCTRHSQRQGTILYSRALDPAKDQHGPGERVEMRRQLRRRPLLQSCDFMARQNLVSAVETLDTTPGLCRMRDLHVHVVQRTPHGCISRPVPCKLLKQSAGQRRRIQRTRKHRTHLGNFIDDRVTFNLVKC